MFLKDSSFSSIESSADAVLRMAFANEAAVVAALTANRPEAAPPVAALAAKVAAVVTRDIAKLPQVAAFVMFLFFMS